MGGGRLCAIALQKQSQHGGKEVNQFLLMLVVLLFFPILFGVFSLQFPGKISLSVAYWLCERDNRIFRFVTND